ncbi:MAG: UpxY family transcription antiterminator [Bacteroidaceae bacterium]|nr:UpxY family transcription antiterminator [Bacteroidaceae bacterium]
MENWFAMRVTYRREMKVKAEMDALGVPAFVPMRRIMQRGIRLKNTLEPAIHNLIFIHATEEKMQALKKSRPELQYMMRQMNGKMEKIIVPQRQMDDFMKVCTTSLDFVEIVSAEQVRFKPGQEVMVISGPLQGIRGHFQRVEGHRAKRLIVTIPGACSATVEVKAEDVTVIPNS